MTKDNTTKITNGWFNFFTYARGKDRVSLVLFGVYVYRRLFDVVDLDLVIFTYERVGKLRRVGTLFGREVFRTDGVDKFLFGTGRK